MSEECLAVIEINQDLCSRCYVCQSVCPYDAIKRDENGKVEIDIKECQVCGICYSACPVSAIKMKYYTYDELTDYVKKEKKKSPQTDALVLMCRGNSPSTGEIKDILKEQGLEVNDYISLRLPCAGRVPTDFVFEALNSGIKNVVSIQCEDDFCRYKEGTKVNTRRLILARNVLKQLGYGDDALKVIKFSRKVIYDVLECVGCGKCVFICPYNALEFEPFATPKVIEDKCVGCGACQLVCPHHAIQVKGFEFETVLKRYCEKAKQLKESGKGPSILAFICQWSEFSTLDNPQKVLEGKNVIALEVPCFKSLDPVHVVNALSCGFDGVMAVMCSSKDCKLQEGRDTAERNLNVTLDVLKKNGLLERFEFYEESPRCEGEFQQKMGVFQQKILNLQKNDKPMEANAKRTK
ncbi:MAG: hydrogenase iron-sulfur subunit [Candidatus Bathyarchaeia archaeon]|jgi:coenzyme F420-reducing hydrogenase delta subunit/ferredoxin-like protein FixX|nr:hydrogenase iron-sulfur subunit [Candidatus Bathyarchaeota archaeon]MDI9578825.1 hydrogenase iron-sulfur subunit [Thermoproteota archaeon]